MGHTFGDGQVGLWNPKAVPDLSIKLADILHTEPPGHRGDRECAWEGGFGNVRGRHKTTWGVSSTPQAQFVRNVHDLM